MTGIEDPESALIHRPGSDPAVDDAHDLVVGSSPLVAGPDPSALLAPEHPEGAVDIDLRAPHTPSEGTDVVGREPEVRRLGDE